MIDSIAAENSTNNTASENSDITKKFSSNLFSNKEELDTKILNIISDLLKNICIENNSKEVNNKNIAINPKIKIFMLKKIPSITLKDYLLRLTKYSKISESTLIFILIYIDRLCQKYKLKINYFNVYKLILASMVIAIKYNEDVFYSSEFYGKLGGVSKSEMNTLEYEFINLLNFNLYIKEELYFKYHDLLTDEENDDEQEDEKDEL